MKTKATKVPIRTIIKGYKNNHIKGVFAMNGALNVRPPFQREFVYKDNQRDEVIRTILKGLPLNTMWWSVNDDNKSYEMLDGQQRTISVCDYIKGTYSVDLDGKTLRYFNLPPDIQNQILNYELDIYECRGTPSQKLAWFKIINIAGEKLTSQELRNAMYPGPGLENAKIFFSKPSAAAGEMAEGYITAKMIRQEVLELALKGISINQGTTIEEYMSAHQKHDHANELKNYFKNVIKGVQQNFPKTRREMRNVDWGWLYHEYSKYQYEPALLELDVSKLMLDEEVTKKSGIYPYLFTNNEKYLNLRAFPDKIKREAYDTQKGKCARCKQSKELTEMEADHIRPWSDGGKTERANCQMLCKGCNRDKGAK